MDSQESKDLKHIRHYKGSVKQFKQLFDDLAGQNTNAYDTPEYQGFNDVHPTRGETKSKHWESSNVESGLNESVMGDLHIMMKEAKNFNEFRKMFYEEFSDRVKPNKDLDKWLKDLYEDGLGESEVNEAAPKIKFSKFVEELGEAWVIIEKTENQMKFEDPNGYAKCKKEWKAIDKASYNLAMAIKRHGKNY